MHGTLQWILSHFKGSDDETLRKFITDFWFS
jgi:hypothetical protein